MNTNKHKVYKNKIHTSLCSERQTTPIIPPRSPTESRKPSLRAPASTQYRCSHRAPTVIQPRSGRYRVPADRRISPARQVPRSPAPPGSASLPRGAHLSLQSTGRFTVHIAAGISLDGRELELELEQQRTMVPDQEVQGTSQTPCGAEQRRMQPGSSAPPAGRCRPHRRRGCQPGRPLVRSHTHNIGPKHG